MNEKCRILDIFFVWQLISHVVADPNDALILNLKKTVQLEVRYKGDWGSICYSKPGFGNNAAKVACQQMGFRSGKFGGKTYLPGTNLKIVLQSVTCTGQEANLSECQLTAADASSSCVDAVQVNCESDPALDGLFDVNLRGNPDQANKGILQATKRDLITGVVTRAVCYDSGTAPTVAGIVCKQMGYPGVETQTAASTSSSGSFFTAVCKGTEQTLAACTLTPGTKCTSNNVIDVECKLNMTTQTTFDVRLSQSSPVVAGVNSGTVEVKKYGKWGVICDTGWDINDANVVCRQLGFKEALVSTGFPTKAKFGQGTGIIFWNNMTCSGDEQSIEECNHDEDFGTGACNSADASGVICSSVKLRTYDICLDTDTTISLPVNYSFLQSPRYPQVFSYSSNTTCSCTSTNLKATSTLSVYINHKMFQQNHVEYLTFVNRISCTKLYGDDSETGPFTYQMDDFTIQFKSDTSSGYGKFRIQLKVSEPVSFTCTKGEPNTAPSVTAPSPISILTTTTSSSTTSEKLIINKDHGYNAGVAAAVTGVVIVLIGFILGLILWRFGFVRFGRKTRNSNGNGLYDETRVPEGVTTGNGGLGNYVNVGGACEVREPVYVNTAFVADQEIEASQDSSDRRSVYENMGDIVLNQTSNVDNNTASAEPVHESTTVQNQGNDANNSTAADGESQYAKLETVNRSEYADFRGLTAKQLKPI